jgi:hypothetical protein
LLEFQRKASIKIKSNQHPQRAAGYLYSRYLQKSFDSDASEKVGKPSTFAKWNDGIGSRPSSISLSDAMANISHFLNGGAEQ